MRVYARIRAYETGFLLRWMLPIFGSRCLLIFFFSIPYNEHCAPPNNNSTRELELEPSGLPRLPSHRFICSNMQTATATISRLSRKPPHLLFLLPSSGACSGVAVGGVRVVPERSDDTESTAVSSDDGRLWRCRSSWKPGCRALSRSAGGSCNGVFIS